MHQAPSRGPLGTDSDADLEIYFGESGIAYSDEFKLDFEFGTVFGELGRDAELALLEAELGFRFPPEYVHAATGYFGDEAVGYFRYGWWRVLNTEATAVIWLHTLSLSGKPSAEAPHENTLTIEAKFRQAGVAGIPFGRAAGIDRTAAVQTDGWLYFDRTDRSIHFAEFDFARIFPVSPSFRAMMQKAHMMGG